MLNWGCVFAYNEANCDVELHKLFTDGIMVDVDPAIQPQRNGGDRVHTSTPMFCDQILGLMNEEENRRRTKTAGHVAEPFFDFCCRFRYYCPYIPSLRRI
jgi:hypothetical protein